MLNALKKIERKYAELLDDLSKPETLSNPTLLTAKSRELKQIEARLAAGRTYKELLATVTESKTILESSDDAELKEFAQEELAEAEPQLAVAKERLEELLAPRDPNDSRNAVFEIRAGTGGDEAALFAGDLYRMYTRHIDGRGWKIEVLSSSPTPGGGVKEVVFSVDGDSAYGILKYESGVHRVQRVPATETQGRVHTSAASVAVLPEVAEVDVTIAAADVKVDVYRSSGPGGQSVNTTDSAVRLTHLPTGLVVICQDEKSQLKNKNKAYRVLRARLYDHAQREQHDKIAKDRKAMVGSGDRSEKIRTYNFPQSRVTDHRIGLTLYKLDQVMEGDLDELLVALAREEKDKRLAAQSEENAKRTDA